MKPFDPKEYKRDLIVMNLHKGRIMLVFPSGAKVNDTSGLLEGDYKDGRRLAIFSALFSTAILLLESGFSQEIDLNPIPSVSSVAVVANP